MDSVRSILPKVLRKRGLEGHATSTHLVYRAQQWLEQRLPNFRRDIEVHALTQGELRVSCAHSVVAQECTFLTTELQEFLAQEFPFARVDQVVIQRPRGGAR